ncbi:acyl-CoA dehydrogenase family protein [Achromobacter sp. GG226]|uniref:acyl-CoA dehydrogenase family protein n=1 Tax=Verticiella alkaliphila TaxID=2779529 RepID=UPI001C0B7CCB|nr:acyl-CoA dehydrogenase family protein [Verticiella sp. GG226]MBU4609400.1 acyl-CoA dehydrogenase family protein [Verticiella sp. GG226]
MTYDTTVAIPDPASARDAYRQHARTWLQANLPAHMRADSLEYRNPTLAECRDWEAAMYQVGLAGMTWPKQYGGYGLSLREHLAVNKEIGALAMPDSVSSISKELAGPIIMAVGTEEQKQAFLPAILEMREYWCQGFSEPDAGSDLARLRTKAVQEGDSWRINGQKIWTSGAAKAHYCLLLTRTGVVADKHRGLLMFAVPMDTPGIRVVPIKSIDGKDSFAEVFFDDVVVPDSARLGAEDEGWSAAIRVLGIERATNRMYRPWRFECELRQLVQACKSDPALSRLLDDGYYQRRIGEVVAQIDAHKGLVERTVDLMMAGEGIGARGSLTKLYWSECHQAFASLALQLVSHVNPGSSPLARRARKHFTTAYLFARAETIYAGTSEVQLDVIAQRILQLPKDL